MSFPDPPQCCSETKINTWLQAHKIKQQKIGTRYCVVEQRCPAAASYIKKNYYGCCHPL